MWGEIDNRFLYTAVHALSLLGRLHELDIDKTVGYIQRCKNFDGGFGAVIGAESHAAMGNLHAPELQSLSKDANHSRYSAVFVCTAALAIMDRLDVIDHETLAWWLSERQLPNGGLNGRPEKLEDVSIYPYASELGTNALTLPRCATVSGSSPHYPSSRNSTG